MAHVTMTNDDGTTKDFFDQAYTDAAIAAYAAAHPATSGEVVKDVVVENEDGTSETMEAEEAPAVESTEDAAPAV